MYNEAINRHQLHYALRLQAHYEGVILGDSKQVLPTMLNSLNDPFHMDVKLTMIRSFLPKIQFIFVDMLIDKLIHLVNTAEAPNGIMVCNINPFMVASAIFFISNRIKNDFPLSKLRIEQFEGDLQKTIVTLLERVYDPYKISKLLK